MLLRGAPSHASTVSRRISVSRVGRAATRAIAQESMGTQDFELIPNYCEPPKMLSSPGWFGEQGSSGKGREGPVALSYNAGRISTGLLRRTPVATLNPPDRLQHLSHGKPVIDASPPPFPFARPFSAASCPSRACLTYPSLVLRLKSNRALVCSRISTSACIGVPLFKVTLVDRAGQGAI